jgi:hypothetical protein
VVAAVTVRKVICLPCSEITVGSMTLVGVGFLHHDGTGLVKRAGLPFAVIESFPCL